MTLIIRLPGPQNNGGDFRSLTKQQGNKIIGLCYSALEVFEHRILKRFETMDTILASFAEKADGIPDKYGSEGMPDSTDGIIYHEGIEILPPHKEDIGELTKQYFGEGGEVVRMFKNSGYNSIRFPVLAAYLLVNCHDPHDEFVRESYRFDGTIQSLARPFLPYDKKTGIIFPFDPLSELYKRGEKAFLAARINPYEFLQRHPLTLEEDVAITKLLENRDIPYSRQEGYFKVLHSR